MTRLRGVRAGTAALVALVALARPVSAGAQDGPAPDPAEGGDGGSPLGQALSLGGTTALYGGLAAWSYWAWYRDAERHAFRIEDDGLFGAGSYSGGADKVGHLYGAHVLTRATAALVEVGGWSRTESSLLGGGIALAFYSLVEVKDGFHFTFSPSDWTADALGVALGIALRELPWLDGAIDLRLAYWPSEDFWNDERQRRRVNLTEDYSGQTYLLAFHLSSIPAIREHPGWGILRYADAVLGFRTRGYEPEPPEGTVPRQELFLGIALNLQRAFDEIVEFADPHGESSALTVTRDISHAITEVVQIPGTALPVVLLDRDGS